MSRITLPNIQFVEDATQKPVTVSYNASNTHTLTLETKHLLGTVSTAKGFVYGMKLEFSSIGSNTTTCTMYLSYDAAGYYLVMPEKTVNMQLGQSTSIATADFEVDHPIKHRDLNGSSFYVWVKVNHDNSGNAKLERSTMSYIPLLG